MSILRTMLIGLLMLLPALLIACDLASDTADEAEQAGDSAVGVAERMSEGTLGDADEEDY